MVMSIDNIWQELVNANYFIIDFNNGKYVYLNKERVDDEQRLEDTTTKSIDIRA